MALEQRAGGLETLVKRADARLAWYFAGGNK